MARNFMKTAPPGIVYGSKRKRSKRWLPEITAPRPSRAGVEISAQSKDKTMCASEAYDIHKVRKAFNLPCKDCKYQGSKFCKWI